MELKRCYGCMNLKSNRSVCEHCGYDEKNTNEIHQLQAGTVLKEQYMIGRVLGQGGFGITYLGWDMYLDVPVAIKEYFPSGTVMREASVSLDVVSYSGDVGARFRNNKERFMREAKMLARFAQEPEIVHIKNFFQANNTAYIVMEYIDGITLKEYVQRQGGKLSVAHTMALMKPVIGALGKVHRSGLVHRDISPDNIMMLAEGRVKLLDFGAVRDVGDADVNKPLTKSTEAILKQGYAPIEQYQNRGSLGPWTDVYSLCATIYYCLTGEIPPDAPERLLGEPELCLKQLVPALSEEQAKAIEMGMELRAQERTASMEDLYQNLYGMCVTEPVKTEPVKTEPVQTEPVQTEPVQTEPVQTEPVKEEKSGGFSRMVLILAVVALFACGIGVSGLVKSDTEVAKEMTGDTAEIEPVEIIAEGECDNGLTWTLDENGLFILGGEGQMAGEITWEKHVSKIKSMEIADGVIAVDAKIFTDCEKLRKVSVGPETTIQMSEKEYKFNENLTLYVYKDSPARTFAYENELYFVYEDTPAE